MALRLCDEDADLVRPELPAVAEPGRERVALAGAPAPFQDEPLQPPPKYGRLPTVQVPAPGRARGVIRGEVRAGAQRSALVEGGGYLSV